MTKLEEVKRDIVDIIDSEGDIVFCTSWVRNRLNHVRRGDKKFALRNFVVAAILGDMVREGTIKAIGVDRFILTDQDDFVNNEASFNVTINVTIKIG